MAVTMTAAPYRCHAGVIGRRWAVVGTLRESTTDMVDSLQLSEKERARGREHGAGSAEDGCGGRDDGGNLRARAAARAPGHRGESAPDAPGRDGRGRGDGRHRGLSPPQP